jgi:uncharacterized protein (DUF362 family)
MRVSRRRFVQISAMAGAAAQVLRGVPRAWGESPPAPLPPGRPSVVSLASGAERRRNALEALSGIEGEILPRLKGKSSIVVKPNLVHALNQLASTHVDAIHGVLDFFAPRFDGPIVVAESAALDTVQAFENFGYRALTAEYKSHDLSLVDLNAEGVYETLGILDGDLHMVPARLAKRLLDPDAFVVCVTPLKTHNAVVATMSVKNMALGAPLRSLPKQTPRWNDKRLYHGGIRQAHYDIFLTAQRLIPNWGVTLIDGYEGMEGNGPSSGTPVPSRVAIASTDFVAADRVGLELMGIDPSWVGYLMYCGQMGLGQYDLDRIEVRGARVSDLKRSYLLHRDIDRMLQWRGPMQDLPPRLGDLRGTGSLAGARG